MIGEMDTLLIVFVLALLGSLLGSFVGAQVWRLRARQLSEDQQEGDETVDKREFTRLKGLVRPISQDRSECLHCHHQLAWYDLIPVISWVTLGGKCRYCRRSIGFLEPMIEIGLAAVFVISYFAWPVSLITWYGLISFVVWLVACTLMAILFVYDAKWYLLPFAINISLIIFAGIFALQGMLYHGVTPAALLSLLLGIGIMGGLYFIFSVFGWVGLGDSILGVGLALLLGTWSLAFLALFLANLLGCLVLIPLAFQKKLHRNLHIPFGPFLILGTFIALLWGSNIIEVVFSMSNAILNTLMV